MNKYDGYDSTKIRYNLTSAWIRLCQFGYGSENVQVGMGTGWLTPYACMLWGY